jgi:cellulose biosynthesis protein BcsQ
VAHPGERPFRVVTVTSNKGGVGKTTVATNLAVYLRALREDLPILFLGLDEQPSAERMFALGPEPAQGDVLSGMRAGSFAGAIRTGQYGVEYVPSSPRVAELKAELDDPFRLERALLRTGRRGVVVVDTKSDLEILTRNAIAASDVAIVAVADQVSLAEADRVFALLEGLGRPRDGARILLSLIDRRVKYRAGDPRDVLALLLFEIRRRGHPLFETFVSRSPLIESLYTNPAGAAASVLHAAPSSLVHRQLRHLADEVLKALEAAPPRRAQGATRSVWSRFPELLRR